TRVRKVAYDLKAIRWSGLFWAGIDPLKGSGWGSDFVRCMRTVNGTRCEQDATHEVSFGGKFDIAVCEAHLDDYRRMAEEWGLADQLELLVRPISASDTEEQTNWGRGKSRGRRWANVTATAEQIDDLRA